MQLPVDFQALFEAQGLLDDMMNVKESQETEIIVSVYVDESAPADLVAHVRNAFASTLSTVRFTLTYLDSNFVPREGDDIAVVVTGVSKKAGPCAAALRAVGVPAMVVSTSPQALSAATAGSASEIPEGDLVSPAMEEDAEEPYVLDDAARASLDDRMGRWIVSVCGDKRLAYALAFPFVRKPLATDAVQATAFQNAAIGLVPIIPGADLPIMTLNQAKMALQIAAAYGQEMDVNRVKELAVVLGGAFLCRTLARELVEFIPVLGCVLRAGVAYGGTSAIGYAMVEYFEGGESVAGVTNVVSRATEAGTGAVTTLREKTKDVVPLVGGLADKHVPVLREKVGTYLPKVVDAATDIVSKAFEPR